MTGAWHLLTGKYPPRPGGIADYTAGIAAGLAGAGDQVHVWTSTAESGAAPIPGVVVHRHASPWSARGLDTIARALDSGDGRPRVVLQYAPNEFEYRGMNLRLCRWLLGRARRGDDVRVMFHEVRYHLQAGDSLARRGLAAVQGVMARTLIDASTQIYVSIPAWIDLIRKIGRGGLPPIEWLPVPSNIPAIDDPAGVAEVRRKLAPAGEAIIGTFGTYGETTAVPLVPALSALLRGRPARVGLLVGCNGERVARRLTGRVVATGSIDRNDVSRYLQACDVLIQPTLGGVCSKQTATMAGLANGRAVVAGAGRLTEPFWRDDHCIALASSVAPGDLVPIAEALLDDPGARGRLGASARATYERRFAVGRTIEVMRRTEIDP